MLKIGTFSKLSLLSVKTLRFYDRVGILKPAEIEKKTGYRLYETKQLEIASWIKMLRQLDLSIEEIKQIISGEDLHVILRKKEQDLTIEKEAISTRLSLIKYILEEKKMTYQVVEKKIKSYIVYYEEKTLENHGEIMRFIPESGAKCAVLNPRLKCVSPSYEFLEYLDGAYKDTNIRVRHNEAVESFGKESDVIKFKRIPETKVLSIYHKGPYETINQAYAYLAKFIEENNYKTNGLARECYIDGIWNKDNVNDWLTEIQFPIQ